MSEALFRKFLTAVSWDEAPCEIPAALHENHQLYRVTPPDGKSLFTGYYEPELRGSLARSGAFQYPLYAPPADLISALNAPQTGQPGQTAWGRVQDGKLVPHATRGEIEGGALAGKNLELLFVDDLVDLFFLHVQGSGKILLPDGSARRVGFAGKNGQAYTSIGAVLRKEEKLQPVTMQSIKAWLRAHPARVQEILNRNASFIFFKFREGDGPIGASGDVLIPEKSLAIDDTIWPYGLNVIIETRDPLIGQPFIRLMQTADTGSAIRGLIRGDIFFGSGEAAGAHAGAMNAPGKMWIILPV